MLRAFCDICDSPCQGKVTGARRYDKLAASTDLKSVGLEFIPLIDGQVIGDRHICDTCLLDLVWGMANQVPGSKLAERIKALAEFDKNAKLSNDSLDQLRQETEKKAEETRLREQNLAEREAALAQEQAASAELIKNLTARLEATTIRHNKELEKIRAQTKQEIEDARHNPDYVDQVARREAFRRS